MGCLWLLHVFWSSVQEWWPDLAEKHPAPVSEDFSPDLLY